MNHLQRMRERQGLAAPPPKPAQAKPATAKPAKQPQPPAAKITAACGHSVSVKEIENVPCLQCRAGARRAKAERHHQRRADAAGRLPDQAAFAVRYDAQAQQWAGTLVIPGHPTFTGSASGVVGLLQNLDRMYRDHVAGAQGA